MPSWLAEIVQSEGGRVRFDRFMEIALYDPVHGYYRVQMKGIGSAGDFSTSPTLSRCLGRAIARWIRAEANELRLRHPAVIELGSGTGELARSIASCFRPWERLRYSVVDLRKPPLGRVKSYDSVRGALEANNGVALLFSNEFVDAFPCRRFVHTESGWDEIWVELRDGRWAERAIAASPDLESTSLSADFAIGQHVEVHESYFSWLKDLCSSMRQGALLTIDYGSSAPENYRGRAKGSLRAYFQHQRLEGVEIYRRPGQQDLTADVNFDDLRRWGNVLGFGEVGYSTQRSFVEKWFPPAFKEVDPATRFLLDPLGAGNAFKVLHQRRLLK
jgi:SAM-dependent MidA family methyltransferase